MLATNWPYTHPAARQPGVSLPPPKARVPAPISISSSNRFSLSDICCVAGGSTTVHLPARPVCNVDAPSFFAFPAMRRGVSYLFLCRLSGRNISRADAAAAGLVEGDHHDIKCTIGCCSDLHVHGSGMQQDRTDRNTAGTRARYCRDSSTCRNRGYDSACGDNCIHHSLRRGPARPKPNCLKPSSGRSAGRSATAQA